MTEAILATKDISFNYPDGTKGLDDLSLTIPQGEKVVILGPNGAGKSTLFLHFNGILEPEQGSVFFEGQRISYDKQTLTNLRKKVGLIFQDPDEQLFSASVYQELSFGPLNLGLSKAKVKQRVIEAMKVTGISELEEKPTHLLSYGQKKRVAIAAVLAMKPKVIIFDEPTAWLDPQGAEEIISFLEELTANGITIVMATHDVDLAYKWADYVYIMNQGTKIASGIPSDVFQNKSLLEKVSLVQPLVLELYQQLQEQGVVKPNQYPKTKQELLKLIKN
ncbi:energy-coupling factor ABC transporter ATP-binding protein [Halanaerobacter jeridensis]|uniref:ABC transporter ATP-binding protein n=1 Tax=Halanaerobacter jeridensis TaxID=706427 RepID=A0A938XSQ4_9FIRM|nr:ATP-binding cassette domain-containing protein [Halanaerobacter jeridensis]MBM7557129.1 cobalt/nickel transport system ATP-binding protein [Halanaerobacter jeridensis]